MITSLAHRTQASLAAIGLIALSLVVLPLAAQAQELPPGSQMPKPSLTLDRAQGGSASLSELSGDQGTAVVFWSNQCPWANKYTGRLTNLASASSGVSFVLVNSNDGSAFPQESASASREQAQRYEMPYLMDDDAELAEAFGAARTPHVFLFDGDGTLVYVGTIDDSPGDPSNVSNAYLKDALDALASGSNVSKAHTKSFGCTIKASN